MINQYCRLYVLFYICSRCSVLYYFCFQNERIYFSGKCIIYICDRTANAHKIHSLIIFVLYFLLFSYLIKRSNLVSHTELPFFSKYDIHLCNVNAKCAVVRIKFIRALTKLFYTIQRLKKQFSPQVEWGPVLVKHRIKVVHLKNFDIDPHWVGSEKEITREDTCNVSSNICLHKTTYASVIGN